MALSFFTLRYRCGVGILFLAFGFVFVFVFLFGAWSLELGDLLHLASGVLGWLVYCSVRFGSVLVGSRW